MKNAKTQKRENVKKSKTKKIDYYKVANNEFQFVWKIKKMKCWNLDGSIETTIFDKYGNQVSKTHTLPKKGEKK